MILMIVIFFFIVIARDLSQCHASTVDYLSHGITTEGIIINAMDDISQSIRDFGWDPLNTGALTLNYNKPILLNGTILDLSSNGLSNIVVNKAKYSVLSSILFIDIEMPCVNISIGNNTVSAYVLRKTYNMEYSASVEMRRLRVFGEINFSFNITNIFLLDHLDLNFSLDDIKSEIRLTIQDKDFTEMVNSFLRSMSDLFKGNTAMIDEFLGTYLLIYVRELMSIVL